MAIKADRSDQDDTSGVRQQTPGDFYRSKSGTPYVTDPTGAVVKDGKKKGSPKMLPYGRPSSMGKSNGTALQDWSERMVLCGVGTDPFLYAQATVVARLRAADPEGGEWKEEGNALAQKAKDAAKAGLAAERGTHMHEVTEYDSRDENWLVLAEAGNVLGLEREFQSAGLDAYRSVCFLAGLDELEVEARIVHDPYRKAGSLDRIVRLTRALTFKEGKRVVIIPAGTVCILDLKTGVDKIKEGYWQSYGVQMVVYAGGVPYDPDTGERLIWPFDVSQEHALIAHLDVKAQLAGKPAVCRLIHVDLVESRKGADIFHALNGWEKQKGVFTHADDAPVETPAEEGWLQQAAAERMAQNAAHGLGGTGTSVPAEQAPEPELVIPAPAADQVVAADSTLHLSGGPPVIDEGDNWSAKTGMWTELSTLFDTVDKPTQMWFLELVKAGNCWAKGVEGKTARRYHIYCALINLIQADLGNDRIVLELIALTLDTDVVVGLEPAPLLATFSAVEAARFSERAAWYIGGTLGMTFDTDGVRTIYNTA